MCTIPWRDAAAEIEAILAALTVTDEAVVLGARRLAAPGECRPVLAQLLYEECFIKGLGEREPARVGPVDATAFVAALSAANAGTGRISSGWRCDGFIAGGRAIVRKDGRRHSVARELVRGCGDDVEIHAPSGDATSSADFYFAYGDALPLGEPAVMRTRFYVNVASDGAAAFVGALTRRLNAERVPFSLKCLRDPHEYYRRDGLVVYADARRAAEVAAVVTSSAASLRHALRGPTPMLTHRVAPGIASAPEPPHAPESYGQRCCRILADAIVSIRERTTARVIETAERITASG